MFSRVFIALAAFAATPAHAAKNLPCDALLHTPHIEVATRTSQKPKPERHSIILRTGGHNEPGYFTFGKWSDKVDRLFERIDGGQSLHRYLYGVFGFSEPIGTKHCIFRRDSPRDGKADPKVALHFRARTEAEAAQMAASFSMRPIPFTSSIERLNSMFSDFVRDVETNIPIFEGEFLLTLVLNPAKPGLGAKVLNLLPAIGPDKLDENDQPIADFLAAAVETHRFELRTSWFFRDWIAFAPEVSIENRRVPVRHNLLSETPLSWTDAYRSAVSYDLGVPDDLKITSFGPAEHPSPYKVTTGAIVIPGTHRRPLLLDVESSPRLYIPIHDTNEGHLLAGALQGLKIPLDPRSTEIHKRGPQGMMHGGPTGKLLDQEFSNPDLVLQVGFGFDGSPPRFAHDSRQRQIGDLIAALATNYSLEWLPPRLLPEIQWKATVAEDAPSPTRWQAAIKIWQAFSWPEERQKRAEALVGHLESREADVKIAAVWTLRDWFLRERMILSDFPDLFARLRTLCMDDFPMVRETALRAMGDVPEISVLPRDWFDSLLELIGVGDADQEGTIVALNSLVRHPFTRNGGSLEFRTVVILAKVASSHPNAAAKTEAQFLAQARMMMGRQGGPDALPFSTLYTGSLFAADPYFQLPRPGR